MSVAERCGCNADARVVSITECCGSNAGALHEVCMAAPLHKLRIVSLGVSPVFISLSVQTSLVVVLRQQRCQSSTNRCRLSIELRYKYFDVSVYFIGCIGI